MTTHEQDDLDAMLSTPLPAVGDDGFAQRIASRIDAAERRDAALEIAGLVAAFVLVVAFVPLAGFSQAIVSVAVVLGSSMPLAIACALLVLTQAMTRLLAD